MIPVKTLLTNAVVVTMNETFEIIDRGAIAIGDDTIAAVGPTTELVNTYDAEQEFDLGGSVVLPGLINAHTHAPMTLLRGLADDLRLDVWLMGYMMPTEREFVSPDFVRVGTSLACAEMIRSGITTFNDMYYFEDQVAETTARIGLRAVCGQTVLKFPSPDARSFEDSLDACRTFIEKWHDHALIVPSVAPHAPYTCTPEILKACAALAAEFDVPLHIHLSETSFEVDQSHSEHGMAVIPWVQANNLFDAKVIAAHCVHVSDQEIKVLADTDTGVAHNPSSNLKLASGIAPVAKMLDMGVHVGIGTDGPASNNDLDMFEETRLAAILAKTARDDPTVLPAKQALALATITGAKALHLDQITGSLEIGKRADLIVLDLDQAHNWPKFDRDPDAIYSRIVYASKSTDVTDVMCNGQWLMSKGELLTVDLATVMTEAAELAAKIDAFLIRREGDLLSKLLALGELQREESFEIQVKVRLDDAEIIQIILETDDVEVVKHTHYRQYDTYFEFDVPQRERLRYREDHAQDAKDPRSSIRTRLTLMGESVEREFPSAIILSRSRFISQATHTLRFYREYFIGETEVSVTKERRRWHIDYRGLRYYINIDKILEPEIDGYFLEIKSRTWSQRDAEQKAEVLLDMLALLGISETDLIRQEYVTFDEVRG